MNSNINLWCKYFDKIIFKHIFDNCKTVKKTIWQKEIVARQHIEFTSNTFVENLTN